MDPQAALDAPRFRWDEGLKVGVEHSFDQYTAQKLRELGHHIAIDLYGGGFGRGQIILKVKEGFIAGTETRCDGTISYY
jgi:gamma-glutamyltranspeptidase/glutathione hydrolase